MHPDTQNFDLRYRSHIRVTLLLTIVPEKRGAGFERTGVGVSGPHGQM